MTGSPRSSRHPGRGKPAGSSRLGVSLAVVGVLGVVVSGCSIGLTAASVEPLAVEDAGLAGFKTPGTGSAVDSGAPRGMAPPTMDAGIGIIYQPDSGGHLAPSARCGAALTADGGLEGCDPDDESACWANAEDGGVGSTDDSGDEDGGTVGYDAGSGESETATATGGGTSSGVGSGSGSGRAGGGRRACHVTSVPGDGGTTIAAPTCSSAGRARSEEACSRSSDCAPGFECVVDSATPGQADAEAAATAGVCRRYCCADVCDDPGTFCYTEPVIGGAVSVPVCIPNQASAAEDGGAPCELLNDAATCPYGQTCQVVTQASGQVACVTPGTATAGQSCDMDATCAAGLACIAGVFPDRTCAQLCEHANQDCPPGQTCMSNAVLANIDAQIGVCASE